MKMKTCGYAKGKKNIPVGCEYFRAAPFICVHPYRKGDGFLGSPPSYAIPIPKWCPIYYSPIIKDILECLK